MGFEPAAAVVTGASQGIGRAIALALAARGVKVALAARNAEKLSDVERAIRDGGGQAFSTPTDVSDPASVREMVEKSAHELGAIDLLVNNAGVVDRRPLVETGASDWDRVLDVNLKGAFLCTRAVLPSMIARRRGRIVNLSSISGRLGTTLLTSYCASKWGLIGLTKAAAEELRPHDIHLFAVCPGSVNTEMLRKGIPGAEPDMEPEDVASVVVYLATEAPSAMTGAAVDVFG